MSMRRLHHPSHARKAAAVRRNENCKRNSKYSDLQGPALESENLRRLRAILVLSTYEVSGCIDERYGIARAASTETAVVRYIDIRPGIADISSFPGRVSVGDLYDFSLLILR
jgi:hypothetical protein